MTSTARNPLRAPPPDILASDAMIEQLYEVEGPRLLRYFQRKTGNCHTAPDLVQDAFVRLAGIGRLSELIKPAAYLQRIARNLLVDRARTPVPRDAFVSLDEWDVATPPVQEDALVACETLQRYEHAIATLPDRTRIIFLLQRADDLTYHEIAKHLGVTLWTVEYHMKRALMHLDRTLDTQ